MILNYVRSTHRYFLRNKIQSLIQVLSLAIGLTVFTLVALYLYDELTLDRDNPNFNQVYRIEMRSNLDAGQDVVSVNIGPMMKREVPEVKHFTRILFEPDLITSYISDEGNKTVQTKIDGFLLVDSGFFHVFPQEFILGGPGEAFDIAHTVVLTESASKRLFGKENPIGKIMYKWNAVPNRVIGVIADPVNTHLKFEALSPMASWFAYRMDNGTPMDERSLNWITHPCYISLHRNVDLAGVEKKMVKVLNAYYKRIFNSDGDGDSDLLLRALKEVHYADFEPSFNYMTRVNKTQLVNFFFLGFGILLLGMINYINLSTARTSLRSREISMRKINGSSRGKLIFYFLVESVITSFFSFLLAVTLVQLLFSPFNRLLQSDINLYFLRSPLAWLVVLTGVIVVGVISGLYPALKMSSDSPLAFLNWERGKQGRGVVMRRGLMLAQFSFAVILLIAIFAMGRQIRFMHNSELGFNSAQVIHLGTGSMNNHRKLEFRKWIVDRFSEVEVASLSQPVPGFNKSNDILPFENRGSKLHGLEVKMVMADLEFFEVYDLSFTYGERILEESTLRNFAMDTAHLEKNTYYVINETCRKILGLEDPIGQTIFEGSHDIIVGVVKDFHFQSLEYEIKPMIIQLSTHGEPWNLSLKINSTDMAATMDKIVKGLNMRAVRERGFMKKGLPPPPNELRFVDETFAAQYEQVERLQTASSYLSVMAVIIACLGLFGLTTFMVQRRVKEVGVRKVLGASESSVFVLLAKDFMKWVSLSMLIGLPIGYILIIQWQRQFAYQASFGIWIYIWTVSIIFLVSLATVACHSLRASRANPVDSIKTE